jgi:hypothetical protein
VIRLSRYQDLVNSSCRREIPALSRFPRTSREAKLRFWVFVGAGFLIFPLSAVAADQAEIDQITNVIERFCLSGKQYQLTADVSGNISIKSLLPGAQGKADVNIKNTTGAVGYLNEEIRRLVDTDTRGCMQPYINRIINIIQGKD